MAWIRSLAVTLVKLTLLASLLFVCSYSYEGKVGGKMEIRDVKTNEEVQELGRFSVEEYNRSLKQRQSLRQKIGGGLRFTEVVEAQRQVVSGINYYLKISATQNGVTKMFESEVVVKPWVQSKKLLNFGPSSSSKIINI